MAATYYQASVKKTDGKNVYINNITDIDRFLFWLMWFSGISFTTVFFYRKQTRKDRRGTYVAYYSNSKDPGKRGLHWL